MLDTHSFLWFIGGDKQLAPIARQLIENVDNAIYLSIVSLWETGIKIGIGKLTLGKPFDKLIPEQLISNQIQTLSINIKALNLMFTLPFHHRDPFARMIIAQAIAEYFSIIGKDLVFEQYPVKLIWRDHPE